VSAQTPTATLPASPTTVVWGYYWAHAKPALTVHSGDTVRMQTLSTCGPTERLIEEGVAAADVPAYNAFCLTIFRSAVARSSPSIATG